MALGVFSLGLSSAGAHLTNSGITTSFWEMRVVSPDEDSDSDSDDSDSDDDS